MKTKTASWLDYRRFPRKPFADSESLLFLIDQTWSLTFVYIALSKSSPWRKHIQYQPVDTKLADSASSIVLSAAAFQNQSGTNAAAAACTPAWSPCGWPSKVQNANDLRIFHLQLIEPWLILLYHRHFTKLLTRRAKTKSLETTDQDSYTGLAAQVIQKRWNWAVFPRSSISSTIRSRYWSARSQDVDAHPIFWLSAPNSPMDVATATEKTLKTHDKRYIQLQMTGILWQVPLATQVDIEVEQSRLQLLQRYTSLKDFSQEACWWTQRRKYSQKGHMWFDYCNRLVSTNIGIAILSSAIPCWMSRSTDYMLHTELPRSLKCPEFAPGGLESAARFAKLC